MVTAAGSDNTHGVSAVVFCGGGSGCVLGCGVEGDYVMRGFG